MSWLGTPSRATWEQIVQHSEEVLKEEKEYAQRAEVSPRRVLKHEVKTAFDEWRGYRMAALRELFLLDHPERAHSRTEDETLILNDDDEIWLRMKYQ